MVEGSSAFFDYRYNVQKDRIEPERRVSGKSIGMFSDGVSMFCLRALGGKGTRILLLGFTDGVGTLVLGCKWS